MRNDTRAATDGAAPRRVETGETVFAKGGHRGCFWWEFLPQDRPGRRF
jgi:hypothetical protein